MFSEYLSKIPDFVGWTCQQYSQCSPQHVFYNLLFKTMIIRPLNLVPNCVFEPFILQPFI